MKTLSKYAFGFRRKQKGLTDYRKRLKILSSKKPRLVIRRSLKNVQASIAEYNDEGDRVVVCIHSHQLKKFGWKYNTGNIPAAYLVGYLLGRKAVKAGLKDAILDIGMQKVVKGGILFAVVAGALDAGLAVPHKEGVLPHKDRLNGTHIKNYGAALKADETSMKRQFGNYLAENTNPEGITQNFEEVKTKIGGK